jgi:hypothetical protein
MHTKFDPEFFFMGNSTGRLNYRCLECEDLIQYSGFIRQLQVSHTTLTLVLFPCFDCLSEPYLLKIYRHTKKDTDYIVTITYSF